MIRKKKQEEVIQTLGLNEIAPKKKSKKRRLLWIILLLPALMILMNGLPEKRVAKRNFRTEPVTKGDLTLTITATGNLAPTNQVEVGCEISGIVKSVLADFNDRVEKGQPLAQIDDSKYVSAVLEGKATLASAEARLMQAQAVLKLKRQNLKRLQEVHRLSDGKAPSKGEMEMAEAEVQRALADERSAVATIEQAKARNKIDEDSLAKTTVYSPISGVVLRRNVDSGQTVAATLTTPVLFTLAKDLTKLQLKVDVDEADVGLIQEGQDATFTVESHPDRSFSARITQLRFDSQIMSGVVTYPALLSVDNSDLLLRPGMTATVKIVARRITDTIKIPNAALRYKPEPADLRRAKRRGGLFKAFTRQSNADQKPADEKPLAKGQKQVWLLENGNLKPVAVTTGPTDGMFTVMIDGALTSGTRVVVETVTSED